MIRNDDGSDDDCNDGGGDDRGGYDEDGDDGDDDDDRGYFACHLKISGVTFHLVCCSRSQRSPRAGQVWVVAAIMIP